MDWTGGLPLKIIFMVSNKTWASKLSGGGGEAKVAHQRFDGAAPYVYVVLHFASWEQRLAV